MKKILIVEGNLKEENQDFIDAGIPTHTESLKESISYFTNNLDIDVANPSSDQDISEKVKDLNKYDGLIWGGSSLNIYNDTIEIRRLLDFMKECQTKIKKILAICWGMQVAITKAGESVKKCDKGSHRGIAYNIEINQYGVNHQIYKDKQKKFNTPAFNFDEVVTVPEGATILSSNQINNIQGLNFKINSSNVWGIQYHPEIPYEKMIRLIHFRKERLLEKKAFKSGDEIVTHVKSIEDEISNSNKELRMKELYNWINYLNEN